jgi:hypothetical protein
MSKSRDKKINQLEYSWITGSQIYVMNCIRHDIAYLVSKLSRFTSNPSIDHWKTKKKSIQVFEVHLILWVILY